MLVSKQSFYRKVFVTWPNGSSFVDNDLNMLRRFFHFASQIERGGHYDIRIRLSNRDFDIKSSNIDLGCGNCLLPYGHALSKLDELYQGKVRSCLSINRNIVRVLKKWLKRRLSGNGHCLAIALSSLSSLSLISASCSFENCQYRR